MSEAQPPKPNKKTMRHATWEWIKSLAVALVIWFVLRTLLVEAFRIPSSSMERTLLVGDFLFVNKALYGAEVPLILLIAMVGFVFGGSGRYSVDRLLGREF